MLYKRLLKTIFILLIVIGFLGFMGRSFLFKNEVPLGAIEGITGDSKGNIYAALTFYSKVQVYDSCGRFIKNWPVDSKGGSFKINVTQDDNILISPARGNGKLLYNKDGILLLNKADTCSFVEQQSEFKFSNSKGEEFQVRGMLFYNIVRTKPSEKILVNQSILLKIFKGPLPAWLIAFSGFIGLLILQFIPPYKNQKSEQSV